MATYNKLACTTYAAAVFNCQRALLCVLLLMLPPASKAEFLLNFNGIQNQSTLASHSGDASQHGQTPWLDTGTLDRPEIVYDAATDKNYYHMILGSMEDGFIQEVYIQVDGEVDYAPGAYTDGHTSNRFTAANGCTTTCWDLEGTPSGGNGDVILAPGQQWNRRVIDAANGSTPLDANAGNASGDPRKMIMRQILNKGELYTAFLKDSYLTKPSITMAINAPDITLQFAVDMRTVSYEDNSAVVQVHNKMWLNGADLPPNLGNFDMSTDTQQSSVNAGQYIYTPGAPDPLVGEGGGGEYTYENGTYDVSTTDWGAFLDSNWSADPAKNNPWSYPEGKP